MFFTENTATTGSGGEVEGRDDTLHHGRGNAERKHTCRCIVFNPRRCRRVGDRKATRTGKTLQWNLLPTTGAREHYVIPPSRTPVRKGYLMQLSMWLSLAEGTQRQPSCSFVCLPVGALYTESCALSMSGEITFSRNAAALDGGRS